MKHVNQSELPESAEFSAMSAQAETLRFFAGFTEDSAGPALSSEIRNYLLMYPLSDNQEQMLVEYSSTQDQKTSSVFNNQNLANSVHSHCVDALGKKIANMSMAFEVIDMGIADEEDFENFTLNYQEFIILCRALLHNAPIVFGLSGVHDPKMKQHLPTFYEGLLKVSDIVESNTKISSVLTRPIHGEYYKEINKNQWVTSSSKRKVPELIS